MFYKTALLTLALAATAPAFAASYTDAQSTNLANAGAACLPALPRYDGNVRKRPLAIFNEGTAASFVTCNFIVEENAYDSQGGVERFDITAKNQSDMPQTVRCTAVIGVDDGNARYIAQSVTLQPGERKRMEWSAGSYGLPNGWEGPINASCLLPVLTGLNEVSIHWDFADRYN